MPFQFQCPQGHLLEAEPFQAGQQCVCPMCGQPFVIPSPLGGPAPAPAALPQPPAFQQPAFPQQSYGQTAAQPEQPASFEPQPQMAPQPEPAAVAAEATSGAGSSTGLTFATENTATIPLLHIPCPKGHELEVPRDMLNQFVECPQCQAQFTLRERDSVEFKKKHSAEMERRWEKTGQTWLQWAIIFAVLVVLGLVTLIALS